ncbi:MAG: tetratricopeptide repeat protein [Anaerolineae bacterium]|nr:tetratricopeptide repeat protein [Anaerolineae bacterium]
MENPISVGISDSISGPTLDPEALYQQGMAHYQRREWEAALACFTRLREMQPDRQGIEALLDELSWFLQLEAVEGQGGAPLGEGRGEGREATAPGTEKRSRHRWLLWLLLPLAVVLLLLGFYFRPGNGFHLLGGQRLQAQVEELRNRGEARLAVGDYEGAIEAFQELVTLLPDDQGAQVGLARAHRLRDLAARYAQAKAAIEQEAWEEAHAHLQAILAVDAAYADAQKLLAFVQRQQRLLALYDEGVHRYDLADWRGALEKFEQVRALDPTYRSEAILEYLFICYLNDGQSLLATAGDSLDAVRTAAQRFGSALSIRSKNEQANRERQLVTLYLEGLTACQRQDWSQALTWLEAIYRLRPDYAGGHLAVLLCDVYSRLGDRQRDGLNYQAALAYYRAALALENVDCRAAQAGEEAVWLALATPTPTPTMTSTPSPTPLPTATPRPQATATPPVATATRSPVPAPILRAPPDGAGFFGRTTQIVLQWDSVGSLAEDEYYVVVIFFWHGQDTWRDEHWMRETSLPVPDYLPDVATGDEYQWNVTVMRQTGRRADGMPEGPPVSPTSATARFTWTVTRAAPAESPQPPTPVPPTDTPVPPTDTPVPPTPTPPR